MTSTHIFAIADGDKIRVDGPDGESFLIEFNQLPMDGYSVTLAQIENGAIVQSLAMRTDQALDEPPQSMSGASDIE